MAQLDSNRRKEPLTWRIAGVWMVVLALGLTLVGVVLAVYQSKALSLRLMAPSEADAARIAGQSLAHFDNELQQKATQWRQEKRGSPAEDHRPVWVDGLATWDGKRFSVVAPSREGHTEWWSRLESKLRTPKTERSEGPHEPELICEASPEGPRAAIVLDLRAGKEATNTLIVNVDLDRLRERWLEQSLPSDGRLVVVPADGDESVAPWSQRLFGPFRFWNIQPSPVFVRQQQWTVIGQTTLYLAMPVLALLTLLIAMTVLKRAVRREMALAEMKAHFVADVSHELKTPLALIRLFGETLLSGRVSSEEKRQEYYAIITRESTRLTHLIENILDFARIESGRKQYRFEPLNLAEVVKETYETYRPHLDHERFEHRLSVTGRLPKVHADPGAVAQIVINLINNAIKYSEDERYLLIELSLDTRRGKRGVLLSIQDRGIGITPEDRAHLFDGFYRSADRRVREKGGTGLGLALVRRIVESHHGTLDVESRLVKGTMFRIFLPAWDGELSEAVEPAKVSAAAVVVSQPKLKE